MRHINTVNRNFGLDMLRAIAILLVVLEHLDWGSFNNLKARSIFGLVGVELFFVLSGYLIGRIVLKIKFKGDFSSFKKFYLRRWLRTLPLYYFAFIVFTFVHIVRYQQLDFHWSYLFFLQTAYPDQNGFFAVSWSLAIEEWFYLLLPWLIYTLMSFRLTSKNLLTSLIIVIVVLLVFRTIYVLLYAPAFDPDIRKSVFFHLDPLLIGVTLALIQKDYLKVFKGINNSKLFIASVVAIFAFAAYFIYLNMNSEINNSLALKIGGLSFIAVCMALIIGYFEQNKYINREIKNQRYICFFFSTISVMSYSIYIWHYEINRYLYYIFYVVFNFSVPLIILSPALTMLISYLSYKYIEIYFIKFRDRLES